MLFEVMLGAKCARIVEQRHGSFSEKNLVFLKCRLNLWSTVAWPKHGLLYKLGTFSECPEHFQSNDAYRMTLRGFSVEWEQQT